MAVQTRVEIHGTGEGAAIGHAESFAFRLANHRGVLVGIMQ
jgi:hypothetical protein